MFHSFQWTKLFQSWIQKLLGVGAGAKNLDAWSQNLDFEIWLHSPGKNAMLLIVLMMLEKLMGKPPVLYDNF